MRRVELLYNDIKNHCLNQLGDIQSTPPPKQSLGRRGEGYKEEENRISIDYNNNLPINHNNIL